MKAAMVVTIVILLFSNAAIAQSEEEWRSWPLADHFTITVAAFFPNLDTRVRVNASDGSTGTTIDFEQTLGLSDTETIPGFGFGWRYAKKHLLQLETFKLDRSGSAIAVTDIRFGDEVFTVDLPISSFFDIDVTSLNYSYSLIFDAKKELAFDIGLSVQDITFGLVGNQDMGIIQSKSELTAPLPTFGIRGGYAFTDKWIGKIGIGYFSLDLSISDEEQLSGEVLNWNASIQHNTFEHVYFGLGYSYFDVRADWSENGLVNSVGYKYHGPMLSVIAAF